jgi:BON domain-containing protein
MSDSHSGQGRPSIQLTAKANDDCDAGIQHSLADERIAKRALDILSCDVLAPGDAMDVLVQDGWVTLSGSVNWYFERTAAEDDVRKLPGVRGVSNKIAIKPKIDCANRAWRDHAANAADVGQNPAVIKTSPAQTLGLNFVPDHAMERRLRPIGDPLQSVHHQVIPC